MTVWVHKTAHACARKCVCRRCMCTTYQTKYIISTFIVSILSCHLRPIEIFRIFALPPSLPSLFLSFSSFLRFLYLSNYLTLNIFLKKIIWHLQFRCPSIPHIYSAPSIVAVCTRSLPFPPVEMELNRKATAQLLDSGR